MVADNPLFERDYRARIGMAALPYIQLYVADYLADTIHLTTEEHGAYMLLIMNYWQTGKPLPKNRLQAIAKLQNGHWATVEQTLSEYFTEDEAGNWVHERIEMDLNKVKSKSIQASKAGKRSAEVKALKSKEKSTDVQHPIQHPFNHTDTDTDTEKPTTTPSSKMNGQVPVQKIVDLYHQMLPTLPRIEKVTPKRAGYIRQRWREDLPALKNWENFYDYVSQSDFLMGKVQPTNGRKPFIANLEWITNQTNFAKILEEHYHGV